MISRRAKVGAEAARGAAMLQSAMLQSAVLQGPMLHAPLARGTMLHGTTPQRGGVVLRCCGAVGLALALGVSLEGCRSPDETVLLGVEARAEPAPASVEELGSLYVPLVTPDAVKHRLSHAVFEITRAGTPVASLDSQEEPDAVALTAELNPGQYQVRLADGWVLEQLGADGSAAPVRAALISPNPASFEVSNGRVTNVAFTFTTSSGTVTFGEGSVSIRLGVADPASLSSCDIANQAGCAAGQHCLLADDSGQTFCASPGETPVGAACSSEQCVFGAQCLSLDASKPGASSCTQLCNPSFPPFGCDCVGLSFSDEVGVCGPPPASACDLLDPASCPDGQACQLPGGSFGVCGAPGALEEGAPCSGEECAAGLDCFGDDPAAGFSGTCYRFCDLAAPVCEFCFEVGTGSIGRCFL